MMPEEHQLPRIRETEVAVGRGGSRRGSIVPFEGLGQHNPARGKGPCFVRATEEWRMRGLQQC